MLYATRWLIQTASDDGFAVFQANVANKLDLRTAFAVLTALIATVCIAVDVSTIPKPYTDAMDAREGFILVALNACTFYWRYRKELRYFSLYEDAGFPLLNRP